MMVHPGGVSGLDTVLALVTSTPRDLRVLTQSAAVEMGAVQAPVVART